MKKGSTTRIGLVFWANQRFGHQIVTTIEREVQWLYGLEIREFDAVNVRPERTELWEGLDGLIAVLGYHELWRLSSFPGPKVCVYFLDIKERTEPIVSTNGQMAIVMATEHLVSLGINRLGCIMAGMPWIEAEALTALQAAVEKRQAEMLFFPPFSAADNATNAELAAFLLQTPKPFGIITDTIQMTRHLIRFIEGLGFRVPEDIAVVCLIDDFDALSEKPTISAVENNPFQFGLHAVKLLQKLIRGETATGILLPPVQVHVRQSTDIVYNREDLVAAALHQINRSLDRPISGQVIANELGVSRNTLHKYFVKQLGHSVMEEVHRQRLDRITSLLADPHIPIKEIAWSVGMPEASAFSRFVRHHTGLSPTAYRNKHGKKRE